MSTGPGAHNGYGLLVPDQFVGGCRYITIQTIQKLSDSGEDVKVRGTRKAGVFFSCSLFLNSARPTISELGTGLCTQ